MFVYDVDVSFCNEPAFSERAAGVMRMFGVDAGRLRKGVFGHKCKLELNEGDVCFITGASGAGKSVILKAIYEQTDESNRIDLDDVVCEDEGAVIDYIKGDVFGALKTLSRAGISDVMSVLNRPALLSEGQRFRYKLAKVLGSDKKVVFVDEFCSSLDRVTACVIAYHIREYAKKTGTIFVLASCHDDLLSDLRPDVVVIKRLAGQVEVVYQERQRNCAYEGMFA